MNVNEELEKIKTYILYNYKIKKCEITDEDRNWMRLRFNSVSSPKIKYDLYVAEPEKISFAPNDYLLHWGVQKEDGSGSGCAEVYKQNKLAKIIDFVMIDIFHLEKETSFQESLF